MSPIVQTLDSHQIRQFQDFSISSGLKVLMSPIVPTLDSHQIRQFQDLSKTCRRIFDAI
jgi:hypothetical protein